MRTRALLVLLAVLGGGELALADGMLDPSFGVGGLVTAGFIPIADDKAFALAILPDGRVVAAGVTMPVPEESDMAVARFLPSGDLDGSFGAGGLVVVPFGGFEAWASAGAALLQPDGRIVVVGGLYTEASGPQFALARLNTDGSLDPTFGIGGKITTRFSGTASAVKGVLQPDGRIVALAYVDLPQPSVSLARYNTDGSLDATFGNGGVVTLTPASAFGAQAVALQPDGKILVAGITGPFPRDFGLIRLLPNGVPDPGFGTGGLVTSDFGTDEGGRVVVVLGDGRLVVGGFRVSTSADFALVRYEADGSLDTTFGIGGLATADSGTTEIPDDLLVQEDGKLLLAGWAGDAAPDHDFILARFQPGGAPDTGFGTGGFVRTDFGASWDEAHAVAIQGPGLLLVAGQADPVLGNDFALARYTAVTPVELIGFGVE